MAPDVYGRTHASTLLDLILNKSVGRVAQSV